MSSRTTRPRRDHHHRRRTHARHAPLTTTPIRMIEELRDELVDRALAMRAVAEHIEALPELESPRHARRIVRRLRAGADRADAAAAAPGTPSVELLVTADESAAIQEAGSEFLVRDGVRRILPADQFERVGRSAVLVGQLAKAGLGDVLLELEAAAPPGRHRLQVFNPLHALVPAITAGHLWALDTLEPTADHHDALVARFEQALDLDQLEQLPANPAVGLAVELTAHALSAGVLVWLRSAPLELVQQLDAVAADVIPGLDGCDLDPSVIEFWVHVGARTGELRLLLDRAGHERLDTCSAIELLQALAPDRYVPG